MDKSPIEQGFIQCPSNVIYFTLVQSTGADRDGRDHTKRIEVTGTSYLRSSASTDSPTQFSAASTLIDLARDLHLSWVGGSAPPHPCKGLAAIYRALRR